MEPLDLLRHLETEVQTRFEANRRVMSFDEYFELLTDDPRTHIRTAPQYLHDCVEFYGRQEVRRPEGMVSRLNLFDTPWDQGRHRLVGQEDAQRRFRQILSNFMRDGRVTRLVLLHGPNGSAKSSFIQCLGRALEAYCERDEGAIYTFNWVFPTNKVAKKRLGFGATDKPEALTSFAHLDDEDIDAVLPGDLRDHPLLLLPRERRASILAALREEGTLDRDRQVGEYLTDGDLSPRSRTIADALLAAYKGDFQRVLQHIQVERFYFSRRYRRGVVTIEPQLHVDATIRQVTMDNRLQNLPPALRNLNLFEPAGDLVDANRGIVEYNDLLKKPVDAFKYLLATCEKGTVTLPHAILHLDTVFIASSNEQHLNAFKKYPDFTSFKGRMDLIKMPYLRDYSVEQAIYDDQVREQGLEAVVTPHTTFVAALWAVLTRLHRPKADVYPTTIREVIARLTPMEKADLYAGTREPKEMSAEQSRELRAVLPDLLGEGQENDDYEGASGCSPREMKQLMLNALQNDKYVGLSALALFEEMRALVKMKSVYEFLKREPVGGYFDYGGFIEQVFDRYLDLVNNDLRSAMGLVSERQYVELFSRYIRHVSYKLKGETIYNEATGRAEPPDERTMKDLEEIWEVTEAEPFRRDLISRVGAFRVDHPGEELDYRRLFPELFEALEQDYYRKQADVIRKHSQAVMTVLAAEAQPEDERRQKAVDALDEADRDKAAKIIEQLVDQKGYPRASIRDAVGALLKHRY